MDLFEKLLEIHKILAEEMRHTATVVWQFSIAILVLHGGAIVASGTEGFEGFLGKFVIVAGFLVSVFFSVMLLRQAHGRTGFRNRIWAVEEELRKVEPSAFQRIDRTAKWCSSVVLAWVLIVESLPGLVISLGYLLCPLACRLAF